MNLHGNDIKIFAANSNRPMAAAMAHTLGLPLGKSEVTTFADGEIAVSIGESVRGSDVFVVQSVSKPVNHNLMELLIMMDAFKRASAGRITAVIPYYGYARQDRKAKARDPISAKLVADLIAAAGADRVLTMDLHVPQIQGFFNIPVDHLLGVALLVPYYCKKFEGRKEDVVVVSPDLGSVARARKFAEKFEAPMAIIDKRRPKANTVEIMNIIGEVRDKSVIIVDDLIDTAGTLCQAAEALISIGGAKEIYACATHGVLSDPAHERLAKSQIKELTLLDTIKIDEEKQLDKISYLPVAPLFAEALERIYKDKPVSPLFV